MWPSVSVPVRAPGGCHGLTVDLRRHAPPAGRSLPDRAAFRIPPHAFCALVAQWQRHGVQDAASVSSTLTEGTHALPHRHCTRTRARAATGRRTGPRSRGLRVRIPPSARTARTASHAPGCAVRPGALSRRSGGRLQNVWPAVRLRSGPHLGATWHRAQKPGTGSATRNARMEDSRRHLTWHRHSELARGAGSPEARAGQNLRGGISMLARRSAFS